MDDRDFYWLAGCIAALAVLGTLQSRLLKTCCERIIALGADVEFLKDHTVARETEARP
jgi:hypothetical protein